MFNLFVVCEILVYLHINAVLSSEINDPIVNVSEGKLIGAVETLVDGSWCYSFKGIRYAAPPIGNLRFKAPLPALSWEGIYNATDFGSVCTQFNKTYQGDEDCLFLNIYTKSLNKNDKIPVMVYIHGGSYYEGSGNWFTPDFLLQHDVLLVTLNYRLDLLGFLTLDIPEVSGNAGMKDQVAALKWIKKNIDQFGGDTNNITIFGESAGGSSVTYHMLSRMSKGLFHKVIAQSGVAINDWAIGRNSRDKAFRVGKILGKETNDAYELLDYLRSLDAYTLQNLSSSIITRDEKYRYLLGQFLPVIEKKFYKVEAFVDENPITLLVKNRVVSEVPLMFGYNSGEGLNIIKDYISILDVYNNYPSYFVPAEVAGKVSKRTLKKFGVRIKRFYFGNRNITEEDQDIIRDILTDIHYAYNEHRFDSLYLCGVSYMYRFNYETDLNIVKASLGLNELQGVAHEDELSYLFYNYLIETPYKNQQKLREIVFNVTKLWTNFAKTGNPTPDDSMVVTWQPYTRDGREYLNIGEPWSIGKYADEVRMKFWDQIYKEAHLPHL